MPFKCKPLLQPGTGWHGEQSESDTTGVSRCYIDSSVLLSLDRSGVRATTDEHLDQVGDTHVMNVVRG